MYFLISLIKLSLPHVFFSLFKSDLHGSLSLLPCLTFHLLQQRPLKNIWYKNYLPYGNKSNIKACNSSVNDTAITTQESILYFDLACLTFRMSFDR